MVDRSLSLYIIEKINENKSSGISKKDIYERITNEFLLKENQLNKRLIEQIHSENIFVKNKKYFITKKGIAKHKIEKIFLRLFNL